MPKKAEVEPESAALTADLKDILEGRHGERRILLLIAKSLIALVRIMETK